MWRVLGRLSGPSMQFERITGSHGKRSWTLQIAPVRVAATGLLGLRVERNTGPHGWSHGPFHTLPEGVVRGTASGGPVAEWCLQVAWIASDVGWDCKWRGCGMSGWSLPCLWCGCGVLAVLRLTEASTA